MAGMNRNGTPSDAVVLALPRGRILNEVMPLVRRAGIEPEADFDNPKSRKLLFDTRDQIGRAHV